MGERRKCAACGSLVKLKPSTGEIPGEWAAPLDLYRHHCIAQQFQTPRLKAIQNCRKHTGAWIEDKCAYVIPAARMSRPRQCSRNGGYGPDSMYCATHGRDPVVWRPSVNDELNLQARLRSGESKASQDARLRKPTFGLSRALRPEGATVQVRATKQARDLLDNAMRDDRAGECEECGFIVSHAKRCSVGTQAAQLAHKEAAKQREVQECRIRFLLIQPKDPEKGRHSDRYGRAIEVDMQCTRAELAELQEAHANGSNLEINWIKGGR